MSLDTAAVRTALDIFGPGTRLDVSSQSSGLLRYARSRVTAQHGERRLSVRARIVRDGRAVSGSLETLDPGAVRALAAKLHSAIRTLPAASATRIPSSRAAAQAPVPAIGGSAERATPAHRHAWFSTIREGLGEAALLGGAIRNDVTERVVADSDGLFRSETLTKAAMQAIAERDGRSASVRMVHRDPAAIDVSGVAQRLLDELTPLPTAEAHRGTCRVLLRPEAAATLLATYGYVALGAAGYAAGRTAVAGKLGCRVASELLTLTDDGSDPDGLPSGFDVEGSPRRRTRLIERGVLTGTVSNLEHAAVTGGVSTGHGVPLGWRFGADPSPSHLFVEPGEASEAELVEACGEGLVVSRLDYLRVLHPKDTLVTGTTRDATYWVRDGKIAAWHPPVRLTFRMDEVLRSVLALGRKRERGELVFMESVVAPAMLIDAGPFRI